jgi:hypothetical protein
MYRVIAILGGGLALAGCSSLNLDALKPGPSMETVRFESEPSGAEAKVSNGQSCRTPCALPLPQSGPYTVTFNLNGYQPVSEQLELASMGDGTSGLRPNPVLTELTPMPPPPPKPVQKKPVKKKPAARPKPTASAQPSAPPPMGQAPLQQAPAPWPTAPAR